MSTFCSRCQGIRDDILHPESAVDELYLEKLSPHHSTLEQLRQAAEQQHCYFCIRIYARIKSSSDIEDLPIEFAEENYRQPNFLGYRCAKRPRLEFQGGASVFGGFQSSSHLSLDFVVRGYHEAIRFGLDKSSGSSRERIASDTGVQSTSSHTSLDMASKWLQNCRSNHNHCKRIRGPEDWKGPTRLLDFNSTDNTVRLQITADLGTVPEYITLSHCWGGGQYLKLTDQTFRRLQAGVPISELAKTFQEAIQVARGLGVSFIWIDALCIIQGSKEDWSQEATAMGSVYQGAVCNIAAADSINGHGGLFRSRTAENLVPPQILAGRNKLFRKALSFSICSKDYWSDTLKSFPLLTRAWVVQERMLAPRILYFGEKQLYWECNTLDCCEMYPQGFSKFVQPGKRIGRRDLWFKELYMHGFLGLNKRMEDVATKLHEDVDSDGFYRTPDPDGYYRTPPTTDGMVFMKLKYDDDAPYRVLELRKWNKLVEEYTACDLTKGSDKLVAISALARHMQTTINDRYLAGLWKKAISQQLTWSIVGKPKQRPSYRAPTWSWASIDTQIEFPKHTFDNSSSKSHIRLHKERQHGVKYASNDHFGQVIGGEICVWGYMIPIDLARDDDDVFLMDVSRRGFDEFRSEVLLDTTLEVPYMREMAGLECFLLRGYTSMDDTDDDGFVEHCLILRQQEQCYERIGVAIYRIRRDGGPRYRDSDDSSDSDLNVEALSHAWSSEWSSVYGQEIVIV